MENMAHLTRQGLVRRPADLRWFEAIPGERIAIRIRGEDVGGAYALVEGILCPSSGPPMHVHENEDEIIEILEGSLRVACNGKDFRVAAGSLVVIPRNTPHTWKNDTDSPVRARALLVPGGGEAMFDAFAGQPIEELRDIASRFGCRFVGPPL